MAKIMAVLPWIKYENIKCKNCIYYTGIKCHGHNEYYGECNLSKQIYKLLQIATNKILSYDKLPEIIDDETICPFVKEWKGYNEEYDETE